MIARVFAKLFGTKNARELRRLQPLVNQINDREPLMLRLSDEELALKTNEFREQLSRGRTLDDILPEAFAVVRETSRRKLGQRHYDVQLIGGIVLHQGKIAEMKTGEGKTLTATLPLYLNALAGKGAHLVTVNDYLARRDAEWMSPIYNHLGVSVGIIQNMDSDTARKEAYQSDITYGTNNEFGFDYLRDNMKFRLEDYVQRDLHYAIVDEVDSILIDEARTPLIISGPADESDELYVGANNVVRHFKRGVDYELDEKERTVQLTEEGVDKIERAFGIDNLYDLAHMKLLHHVTQALKAHGIFRRDVDYVVRDDQVMIVDEFTGRILPGRRYSDGLHQALEAKEGVQIQRETQTLASITLQNYFRLYRKLAGMTGTAATEAEEFWKIYKLDVVAIPTNMPMIRDDKADLIFLTKNAKHKAIVEDVKERYKKGQPVLIGTIAIEMSELLSDVLKVNGIPHEVLNAKNHAREAEIVAYAGHPGRVTIATNMAGRGTDIKLTPESVQAGGLYILGTERHEARRIDNQLRGRSGRQGDPGESRFYISLEDDLIRRFAGDSIKHRMQKWAGMTEEETIEAPFISKTIARSQEKVEKYNFDVREHLLKYDDVLNQQRTVVYQNRREILEGETTFEFIRDMVLAMVRDLVYHYAPQRAIGQEEINKIFTMLAHMTEIKREELEKADFSRANSEDFSTGLANYVLLQYDLYRKRQRPELISMAEKWVLLEAIDTAWKQHMLNLDHLKEGIGLRGWGQKNPLIEYKREAFAMFEDMMKSIRGEVVGHIFHLNLEHFDTHALEEKRERELEELSLGAGGQPEDAGSGNPGQSHEHAPVRNENKIGRNDNCHCGSGKKYKKCCGR